MCGRFDQHHSADEYALALGWDLYRNTSEAEPLFNVAPGTLRPVFHIDAGAAAIDDVHWGYQASWAVEKIPVAINTRLEKISNRYWGRLFKNGRAIVAADGWYEWTGEKGHKQPWHIHRRQHEPLFMAALANFASNSDNPAAHGFTLVTAAAAGGMVDLHARRPLVFTAADAAIWLDPGCSPEQASQLAHSVALGPQAFAWFKVAKAVGKVSKQGPELVVPIELV